MLSIRRKNSSAPSGSKAMNSPTRAPIRLTTQTEATNARQLVDHDLWVGAHHPGALDAVADVGVQSGRLVPLAEEYEALDSGQEHEPRAPAAWPPEPGQQLTEWLKQIEGGRESEAAAARPRPDGQSKAPRAAKAPLPDRATPSRRTRTPVRSRDGQIPQRPVDWELAKQIGPVQRYDDTF